VQGQQEGLVASLSSAVQGQQEGLVASLSSISAAVQDKVSSLHSPNRHLFLSADLLSLSLFPSCF
jgi:hypothetical protein